MATFRKVPHDLLDVAGAGTLYVAGSPSAKNVLIFCAGWPDKQDAFLPLAARLEKECGCLVGVTCMPEYDRCADKTVAPHKPWGYDLDQMGACFAQAAAALRAESTRPDAALTVLTHDWGFAPGFSFANSHGCDRVVAFDVLGDRDPRQTYVAAVKEQTYQVFFGIAFLLSRLSVQLARWLWIRPVGFIVFKVFRKWFAPAGPLDQGCASLKPPNPFHLYPYWHLLCLRWFSSRATFERMIYNLSAERLITEKKTPVLFMYGEEKRNKFHTDKIVELVRATPGCKVVPVANAGHWLYHESQQAELCFREVKAFVLGK